MPINQNLSELVLLLADCLTSLWKQSLSDGVDVAGMLVALTMIDNVAAPLVC